jgi:hypothetical protein
MIHSSGRLFANRSLVAVLDQGLVSFANLCVGLSFIRFGTKEAYGLYGLLFAGMMLTQNIQNAVVLSPMTTVVAGLTGPARAGAMRWIAHLQRWVVLGLVCASCTLLWFHLEASADRAVMAASLAAAVAGLLTRESRRAIHYLNHDVVRAFAGSCLFAAILVVGLVVAITSERFTLINVLLLTAVAGLSNLIIAPAVPVLGHGHVSDREESGERVRAAMYECARWALPSVMVSWIVSNAFVYPVGAVMGLGAVAEISAARLLLMPIGLVITGWGNALRPRASAMWGTSGDRDIKNLVKTSVIGLVSGAAAYTALVVVAYPLIAQALGAKYLGIGNLVAAWGVFFICLTIRSVGGIAMLSAPEGFKPLFKYGLASIATILVLVPLACFSGAPVLVIFALAAAEAVLAGFIWLSGWPGMLRLRAQRMRSS